MKEEREQQSEHVAVSRQAGMWQQAFCCVRKRMYCAGKAKKGLKGEPF